MPTPKKKTAAKTRPRAARTTVQSPVPIAWLTDAEGRERALDTLASWVVSTLQAAPDDAAARETLEVAVTAFCDIRTAAGQPRGGDAGRFFIVDAVGLGASNRPVPWQVLAETVSQERLDRFSAIFDEVEQKAR